MSQTAKYFGWHPTHVVITPTQYIFLMLQGRFGFAPTEREWHENRAGDFTYSDDGYWRLRGKIFRGGTIRKFDPNLPDDALRDIETDDVLLRLIDSLKVLHDLVEALTEESPKLWNENSDLLQVSATFRDVRAQLHARQKRRAAVERYSASKAIRFPEPFEDEEDSPCALDDDYYWDV